MIAENTRITVSYYRALICAQAISTSKKHHRAMPCYIALLLKIGTDYPTTTGLNQLIFNTIHVIIIYLFIIFTVFFHPQQLNHNTIGWCLGLRV